MYHQFIIEMIDLPDFKLRQMVKRSYGWVALLEPTPRCFLCPICGRKSIAHKRQKKRTLRHRVIPHFGFIHVEVPVYHQQCTTCLHVWSVQWQGVPQHGKVTDLFKKAVVTLCHESALQSVANTLRVPYTTVERWYYQWAEEEVENLHTMRTDPTVVCFGGGMSFTVVTGE
ncbi:hypothetical protein AOX59_09165 [Lentibacillus amyloliquefaciens]|uniref:Transposase IS204/IS1001/IS1096/IS1165 helix-turn-helix domain-containing protein n=1 Tax=Lentibacillus amyloliquefaciens TaxID=1472767 RepID=A0A0U4F7K9_9BACI|nr:hypothetical protein AOX59_09165 [Lentibacillus amyloliquefaciens]